jgi:cyclin A
MAVQRSKLQLVGTACMFIAAKYEEIYPPDVAEFVYITDDTYNKRQVPSSSLLNQKQLKH